MSIATETLINITEAKYLDDYRIALFFDDGTQRVVDFELFLRRARNPMTTKYLDANRFKEFQIVHGNIEWNGKEMAFPVADLYAGRIE